MIVPGMVSATFRDEPVEEVLKRCREAGLQAIEWSENAHVQPDDSAGAAELYRRTTEEGIRIAAYGSYYRLGQNEPYEEVFRRSIRSAQALHAPVIRIWAGTRASGQVSAQEREQLAKEAAVICHIAQECGIRVAMEWHKNTLTDTNASALQFLQEVHHPNLYCLWQPTVALSMEERKQGIASLQDRLLNLHVYYWLDGVRRPLREGIGEWKAYLSQIDPAQDRYALLEFVMNNTKEQFLEDAAVLKELLEDL